MLAWPWIGIIALLTTYLAQPRGKFGLLMSSVIMMVPLLFLYGLSNRESKCNMMRFLFRNSHASPGNPNPDLRRSFARIAALEMIFVR